jgi:hypothetical protein
MAMYVVICGKNLLEDKEPPDAFLFQDEEIAGDWLYHIHCGAERSGDSCPRDLTGNQHWIVMVDSHMLDDPWTTIP